MAEFSLNYFFKLVPILNLNSKSKIAHADFKLNHKMADYTSYLVH